MQTSSSRLHRQILLVLAMLSLAPAALAHHSFAMFDATQTLTARAEVKEFQWTSPHAWLELVLSDESGKERSLSLEMNGTSGLREHGWKPGTLKRGDTVTVVYHPMRDGMPAGQLMQITTADGRKLTGQ